MSLVVFKQKKKMAATLLGEAAILLPVLDSQSYQDTGGACCHQQVLDDSADKGEVLCGLVQLYQAIETQTTVDNNSGQQDHETVHDLVD